MTSLFSIFLVSVAAGSVAGVAGFGIGSLLTPLFVTFLPARIAVAAVAIPHFIGTAVRFFLYRRHIDWPLLRSFGLASAIGGLAGAFLHTRFTHSALLYLLSVVLIMTGVSTLSGWAERHPLRGGFATLGGVASGLLGGLVGNQGGIRAGALIGAGISKEAFVATSTAVALLVDVIRLPFYLAQSADELMMLVQQLAVSSAGVVLGTFLGVPIVRKMSPAVFRLTVGVLVMALGIWILENAVDESSSSPAPR